LLLFVNLLPERHGVFCSVRSLVGLRDFVTPARPQKNTTHLKERAPTRQLPDSEPAGGFDGSPQDAPMGASDFLFVRISTRLES
jgi:hypothetical protein